MVRIKNFQSGIAPLFLKKTTENQIYPVTASKIGYLFAGGNKLNKI
jgi:hypothetical protein